MSYSTNDDDIFDYDPDQDVSSTTQFDSYQKSFSSDNSSNPIVSSAKDIFDDLVSNPSSNDTIDEVKVKLAISFQSASSSFYAKVQPQSYANSVSMVLDTLTNGDFSMVYMFNHKQALITQRLRYITMMNQVIKVDSHEKPILESLFNFLDIEYDINHIEIFYTTNLNIALHCLHLDRAIYKTLAKKLNLPVKQHLLDDTYLTNPDYFISSLNDSATEDYFNSAYSKILRKIADEGVLSELSNLYGVEYGVYSNEEN